MLYIVPKWLEPHRVFEFNSDYAHCGASRSCWIASELCKHGFNVDMLIERSKYKTCWKFNTVDKINNCYDVAMACEAGRSENIENVFTVNLGSSPVTGFDRADLWFANSMCENIFENLKPISGKTSYVPFGVIPWPAADNPYNDTRKKVVYSGIVADYPQLEMINQLAGKLQKENIDFYVALLIAADNSGKMGISQSMRGKIIHPHIKFISDFIQTDYWHNGCGAVDFGAASAYFQHADCGLAFASDFGYGSSKIDEYFGNGLPAVLVKRTIAADEWRVRQIDAGTVCEEAFEGIMIELQTKRNKKNIRQLALENWSMQVVAHKIASEIYEEING